MLYKNLNAEVANWPQIRTAPKLIHIYIYILVKCIKNDKLQNNTSQLRNEIAPPIFFWIVPNDQEMWILMCLVRLLLSKDHSACPWSHSSEATDALGYSGEKNVLKLPAPGELFRVLCWFLRKYVENRNVQQVIFNLSILYIFSEKSTQNPVQLPRREHFLRQPVSFLHDFIAYLMIFSNFLRTFWYFGKKLNSWAKQAPFHQ